jgi:hypothetical protein
MACHRLDPTTNVEYLPQRGNFREYSIKTQGSEMKNHLIVGALAIAAAIPASAADVYDNSGHILLGMGLTFGGKTLVTVHFTNGDSENVKSGGLVHFYGGYEYRMANRFSVRTAIGYHVDDINAKNGSVKFDRYPLEVLGHYGITDNVRIGGGLRYVMNPKISSSGAASVGDYKFDDATGFVIEAEYLISPHVGVTLRGVSEKYQLKGSSNSVRGDHGGIYANYYF